MNKIKTFVNYFLGKEFLEAKKPRFGTMPNRGFGEKSWVSA
jgi:hypothetical protein